jgi:hypothetical protein
MFLCASLCFIPALSSHASSTASTVCPRYAAGSALVEPQDLFSAGGILRVAFNYETRIGADGNTLYCFMTPDGTQSPTLHVRPGDELLITLKNNLPAPSADAAAMHGMNGMQMAPITISSRADANCGGMIMTDTSVNIHYHETMMAIIRVLPKP